MNKKIALYILLVSLVTLMVGCGNKSVAENTEEDVISTIVNGSAVVIIDKEGNVIDYGDDNTETSSNNQEEINTEDSSIEDVKTEEISSSMEESSENIENNTETSKEQTLNYIIYYPDEQAAHYLKESFVSETIEAIPDNILLKLKEKNVLRSDIKINNVTIEDNKCTVDFSKEFYDQISQMGISGEYCMMIGVVNSFIDTYINVDYVQVTVDGKGFETGHCDYYDFFSKFEE
jgi:hypothetical protein